MAYSFQKMFFIGQNLSHVNMTYSFHKLLNFFLLTLIQIFIVWSLFLTTSKEISLHVNTNSKGNQSRNKNQEIYISTCFWYRCWKILLFYLELKSLINNFYIFSVSWTFLETAIRRCQKSCSKKICIILN